jgi:hypothetical protein
MIHIYIGRAQQKQWEVVIIGDSHAHGCAANVKHSFKNSYVVSGVVKPEACAETLNASAKNDIKQLANKDATVSWGGATDVGKNNSEHGFRHIVDSVTDNNHTNINLVSIPHWHDSHYWLREDKEVEILTRN